VTSTSLTYSKPSVTIVLDEECGELQVMTGECGGIGATQELDAFGQQVTRMPAHVTCHVTHSVAHMPLCTHVTTPT
jgi:hypothetical protein